MSTRQSATARSSSIRPRCPPFRDRYRSPSHNPALPKREDLPTLPIYPYAVAKLAAESYCRSFTEVYGLETVALRYFNVFGPRQDPLSQDAAVIPKFITALLEERSPYVHGDGEQSRDFTYIDNVVEANVPAATAEGG